VERFIADGIVSEELRGEPNVLASTTVVQGGSGRLMKHYQRADTIYSASDTENEVI
jgi:hypothetical protein